MYFVDNSVNFVNSYDEDSEYHDIMLTQYEELPFFVYFKEHFVEFKKILSLSSENYKSKYVGLERLYTIDIFSVAINI